MLLADPGQFRLDAVDVGHGGVEKSADLETSLLLSGRLGAPLQDHVELLVEVGYDLAHVCVENASVVSSSHGQSIGEKMGGRFQRVVVSQMVQESVPDAFAAALAHKLVALGVALLHRLSEVSRVLIESGIKLYVRKLLLVATLSLFVHGFDADDLEIDDPL